MLNRDMKQTTTRENEMKETTQNPDTTKEELLDILASASANIHIDAGDDAVKLVGRMQVAIENIRGYREDGEVGTVRL